MFLLLRRPLSKPDLLLVNAQARGIIAGISSAEHLDRIKSAEALEGIFKSSSIDLIKAHIPALVHALSNAASIPSSASARLSTIAAFVHLLIECKITLQLFEHTKTMNTTWVPKCFTLLLKIASLQPEPLLLSALRDLIINFPNSAKPHRESFETLFITELIASDSLVNDKSLIECLASFSNIIYNKSAGTFPSTQDLLVKVCNTLEFIWRELTNFNGSTPTDATPLASAPRFALSLTMNIETRMHHLMNLLKKYSNCLMNLLRNKEPLTVDILPIIQWITLKQRGKSDLEQSVSFSGSLFLSDDLITLLLERIGSYSAIYSAILGNACIMSMVRPRHTEVSGYRMIRSCLETRILSSKQILLVNSRAISDLKTLERAFITQMSNKKRKFECENESSDNLDLDMQDIEIGIAALSVLELTLKDSISADHVASIGRMLLQFASESITIQAWYISKSNHLKSSRLIPSLLNIFISLIESQSQYLHEILPVASKLFVGGQFHFNKEIRDISRNGLRIIGVIIHPRLPPSQARINLSTNSKSGLNADAMNPLHNFGVDFTRDMVDIEKAIPNKVTAALESKTIEDHHANTVSQSYYPVSSTVQDLSAKEEIVKIEPVAHQTIEKFDDIVAEDFEMVEVPVKEPVDDLKDDESDCMPDINISSDEESDLEES